MKGILGTREGRAGLMILGFLSLAGLVFPSLPPWQRAGEHWNDLAYWQDSPSAAPPAWTALFTAGGSTRLPARLEAGGPRRIEGEGGAMRDVWSFEPRAGVGALILVLPAEGRLALLVEEVAVDGTRRELTRRLLDIARGEPARISLGAASGAKIEVSEFRLAGRPQAPRPWLVAVGSVYGLLGTDAAKRDLFAGLVLGLRWAILLGVLVGFLTIATGIALAIAAACLGGWAGGLINRIYEFFSLAPLVPFLIVLSAAYKPTLWTFAGLALLFYWTRAFKPLYAQALRVREEGHVEAARSIGASRWRRAFYNILPALLPYGFSVMALSVPSIILAEAGVSLLGLGDSKVVTWGRILHDALVQGAVVNRLWWWILPPGLMMALTALAFSLLARGFDRLARGWR